MVWTAWPMRDSLASLVKRWRQPQSWKTSRTMSTIATCSGMQPSSLPELRRDAARMSWSSFTDFWSEWLRVSPVLCASFACFAMGTPQTVCLLNFACGPRLTSAASVNCLGRLWVQHQWWCSLDSFRITFIAFCAANASTLAGLFLQHLVFMFSFLLVPRAKHVVANRIHYSPYCYFSYLYVLLGLWMSEWQNNVKNCACYALITNASVELKDFSTYWQWMIEHSNHENSWWSRSHVCYHTR